MDPFYHCYRHHRFTAPAAEVVNRANGIIGQMRKDGYILTLRQLYYQFVSNNWLENSEKEYKRLGRIVTRAREAGVMDWYGIEDRGRDSRKVPVNDSEEDLLRRLQYQLRLDMWSVQDEYLEVWVEKSALEGVIQRPSNRFRVTYMACKGYLSTSEAWRAGRRFERALADGKHCTLIHLADHDPSGLNMTQDNDDRVALFAKSQNIPVERIALNFDQVQKYNPPPNPAKQTDSRYAEYKKQFGSESWELDALRPAVLDELIASKITDYIDFGLWNAMKEEEERRQKELAHLSQNYESISHFLRHMRAGTPVVSRLMESRI